MLIAIPTGVKILNWISTMWGGQIRFTTAMLFGIALVALFSMGGISGIMHSSAAADLQQTDSYFVVAHFHYVLFGGAIFGIFAGVYHYFPKMTGRFLDETLGKWHFWVFFVAMNLTFFPMHFSGLLGMPRRIYTYDAGQGWELFNMMASLGAFLQGAGMLIFFYNMWRSYRQPATAPADPWGAPTLEWTIPSPPPDYNFAKLPQVTSRYPLWDEKGREAMIQHRAGDRIPSAEELHIPMPKSTAKPFVVALFMTCMLASLIFLHVEGMATVGILATIAFALAMVGTLYSWLLSPLE
jgi:cytochrome c oxidase subunit 1